MTEEENITDYAKEHIDMVAVKLLKNLRAYLTYKISSVNFDAEDYEKIVEKLKAETENQQNLAKSLSVYIDKENIDEDKLDD